MKGSGTHKAKALSSLTGAVQGDGPCVEAGWEVRGGHAGRCADLHLKGSATRGEAVKGSGRRWIHRERQRTHRRRVPSLVARVADGRD